MLTEPKTSSSRRLIALDARTTQALRNRRKQQLGERLAYGEAWEDNGLVFVREDGTPPYPAWESRLEPPRRIEQKDRVGVEPAPISVPIWPSQPAAV